MYSSLRDWLNIPLQVFPCTGSDGAGDKTFGDATEITCYAEDKLNVVVNQQGVEVMSQTTLYLDGVEAIKGSDEVIYNSVRYPIHALGALYEKGTRSIWVVYI